jgi:hypothetical protein
MNSFLLRCAGLAAIGCLLVLLPAQAALLENFDGGGTTPYALTSSSGTAGSVMAGGPSGSFGRLVNLNGSNNNSIAFNEEPTQTGSAPYGLRMAFDFRMTDDAANAAAGGCCDSAADGLGVGLFATARYGASGGTNPATGGAGDWERPAFADAFTVGFDVFQNIDVVTLNWADTEVASADVESFLDLNSNVFHRALIEIKPSGSDAVVNMKILADVQGNTTIHDIFTNQVIPGLNLAALPGYRLIAGGRTGGAFTAGDLDNISLASLPIPEPTSLVMLGLGGLLLLRSRRRAI